MDSGGTAPCPTEGKGRDFRHVAQRSLEPAYTWLAGNIDVAELAQALPLLERVRAKLDDERNGRI